VKLQLRNIIYALVLFAAVGCVSARAQIVPPDPFPPLIRTSEPERPKNVTEGMAKQRLDRTRKEHEKLIERGEEALKIFAKIEASFEKNSTLSSADRKELEEFEKVVKRIRKDLGGDSDDYEPDEAFEKEIGATGGQGDAVRYLKDATMKLVNELQKTTRYSISAVAVQTSNTVINIAQFLRLRR
jgi:hypothetical protein